MGINAYFYGQHNVVVLSSIYTWEKIVIIVYLIVNVNLKRH